MKKFTVLISGVILLMQTAFAGGILTNSNQSAQFVRMLSRNASKDLDAVYYNPAGLAQLNNGFYFSLNNQSIFQTRTITNDFPLLKNHEYEGKATVPAFPTAFAVYKLDKWAFSAGFGPNSGGGAAKYNKGLPSFEIPVSAIPKSLAASGIPTADYSSAISFEGSSVFWGIQLNGTYAINEILSLSIGGRMINAKNAYSGYLKDIKINPLNATYGFDGKMRTASSVFTTLAGASSKVANDIQPYVTAASSATLAQLVASKMMAQSTADALAGGLGISPTSAMTISQIQSGYNVKAKYLSDNSAATLDQNVDAEQTGTGFTPIIGADIHLDKFNWGIKYEFKTTLELTNKNNKSTTEDRTGKFPDGVKIHNDIPAILSSGLDYQATEKLKASGSVNLYFDKNVNWGMNGTKERKIDNNSYELSFGLEYKLTDKFALSAGYLYANGGVSKDFQTDLNYYVDSHTIAMGFQWNVNKKLTLDVGALKTTYKDDTKTITDPTYGAYHETYGKDNIALAFGISYKIF